MAARFATVTEKEIHVKWTPKKLLLQTQNPTVWLILKQLSPLMSLPGELDIYLAATRFGKYQSLVTST